MEGVDRTSAVPTGFPACWSIFPKIDVFAMPGCAAKFSMPLPDSRRWNSCTSATDEFASRHWGFREHYILCQSPTAAHPHAEDIVQLAEPAHATQHFQTTSSLCLPIAASIASASWATAPGCGTPAISCAAAYCIPAVLKPSHPYSVKSDCLPTPSRLSQSMSGVCKTRTTELSADAPTTACVLEHTTAAGLSRIDHEIPLCEGALPTLL
jgi:hypothetical protein